MSASACTWTDTERSARSGTRTRMPLRARDFKSLVSTDFTIRAAHDTPAILTKAGCSGALRRVRAAPRRARAGSHGFATRASPPMRHDEAPMNPVYDVFIIGAGQAGIPLAHSLARAGRRVAL